MPWAPWEITLDQAHSTYGILAAILALVTILGFLLLTGRLEAWLGFIAGLVAAGIERGFHLWERTLAWARWPAYMVLVGFLLGLGIHYLDTGREWVSLLIAIMLLTAGASACTAFMFVSLERYDVSRGYKAVHNPAKGQELARHVTRYGDRLGPLMLVFSGMATIAGFALLNQALYEIVGQSWYTIRDRDAHPGFLDFLAFGLIHLLSVVDVLDLIRASHFVSMSFVRQGAWPVSVLLVGFKSFFTLVLIQQVVAAIRQQRLLWEMVADFWSPHAPIHERARGALSQFGHFTVAPLMRSLGEAEALTREQRDELPAVLADVGPLAIPELMTYLADEREVVRGVAAVALGRLGATDAIPLLVTLCGDPHEGVRACAIDALGAIGEGHASASNRPTTTSSLAKRWRAFALLAVGGQVSIAVAAVCWRHCRRIVGKPMTVQPPKVTDPVAACREALRSALIDPSVGARVQAMIGLGRIGPSAAAASANLIPILEAGSEQEQVAAANALGQIQANDERTLPALVAALGNPVAAVRAAAAAAIGHYRRLAAAEVPALVALLDDPLDTVRDAATQAIQEIGILGVEATHALEERLAHPDNVRRAQTAEALGEMGEAAQPAAAALVDSLTDDNDVVRGKAAEALGRIGEGAAEVAVPALAKSLDDEDNTVQARAAEALGQMGPQGQAAIPELVKSLHCGNAEVRARSAEALGQLRALEARRELESACRDDDPPVRAQAARALGAVGTITPSTRDVLLILLADAAPPVRAAAAEALAVCRAGEANVIAAVAALLDDDNEDVVVRVMRALPRFGAQALAGTFDILCRRLSDERSGALSAVAAEALGQFGPAASAAGSSLARAAQIGDAQARQAALRALTRILPPEAAGALAGGLHDAELGVRRQASAGLTRMANPPEEIKADLLEAIRDPDQRVKANAATVLAKFESLPPEAEPLLLACVAVSNPALRRPVAAALGRFNSSRGREALRTLAEDPNVKVREAAQRALESQDTSASKPAALESEIVQPQPTVEHAIADSGDPMPSNV